MDVTGTSSLKPSACAYENSALRTSWRTWRGLATGLCSWSSDEYFCCIYGKHVHTASSPPNRDRGPQSWRPRRQRQSAQPRTLPYPLFVRVLGTTDVVAGGGSQSTAHAHEADGGLHNRVHSHRCMSLTTTRSTPDTATSTVHNKSSTGHPPSTVQATHQVVQPTHDTCHAPGPSHGVGQAGRQRSQPSLRSCTPDTTRARPTGPPTCHPAGALPWSPQAASCCHRRECRPG